MLWLKFVDLFAVQGLWQKVPDKQKIANASGNIYSIFLVFNPTPIMDVVSKFHDIRIYWIWVIVSEFI